MAFTKYASLESAQVLDLKGSRNRVRTASLSKLGEFDDYRTEDGFLYARIRAISSRVNKNHDGWPSVELAGSPDIFDQHTASEGFTVAANSNEYGFSTFMGKPIFIDHHNSDPSRARGVIVDSKFHVDDHKTASLDPYYASKDCDPEHKPAAWVELLLEVDAKSFPRLAKAIVEGSKNPDKGIDGFSMGCDVERSICNICKNAATSPDDYCDHIRMKGATFKDRTGSVKKSYENCYGVKFFEISAVFDPADETALLREVKSSSVHTAENPLPQADLLHAPEAIDTLRKDEVCPVCGSTMDEDSCEVCGYTAPPQGFDNPDLSKAKEQGQQEQPDEAFENLPEGALGPQQPEGQGEQPSSNPLTVAHVRRDMEWKESIPARLSGGPSDEPSEEVLEDSTKPITSSVRTAQDFIAAAGATRRTTMNHTADAASGAPGVASPDKNVDVVGVGGVADASNEQASKADSQVDVAGVGGVGVDSVSAESTESLPNEVTDESAGFDTKKDIEAIPTKTFDDGSSAVERQADPVSGEPFPASEDGVKSSAWIIESHDDGVFPDGGDGLSGGNAVQGVDPVDPIGRAQDRVDVLDHVTSPSNNSGPTTTWTGTDGNGVLRQQEPTTSETLEAPDGVTPVRSSHIFTAFKLADLEVELGLIPVEKKYERVASLEQASTEALQAQLAYAQRVKTSGLARKPRTASRVPVLGRNASTQAESSAQDDTVVPDEALFS